MSILVDNYLTKTDLQVVPLDKVENYNEYYWLLTSSKPLDRREIVMSLVDHVPKSQIIDMYEDLSVYSEKYRLLSQINTREASAVSVPCVEFLKLINVKKNEKQKITVGEIGVGRGATAVEACKKLAYVAK